ncbi:MAG: carboxypeptidase regulatory-like domain-containing protein [Homoserinimonas sp.]|nr:carboxypeptidase regulatory-like domain-containing protein [Fimbriimonadaceae bacterium]MCO5294849.1 carboxypeptidase regulatory-like domain-containing protein [Homoserinimonas sp.]
MKFIRRRLATRVSDAGFGIIEIIVAMLVFAIIATGIAYTMVASLDLTRDSTAREQAANLAAQEIDLARSIDNLFNLQSKTTTTTINGTTFTITRTAKWVSDPNVDQRCGIGGGILRYKRVNVTVGWVGMTSLLPPVHADTLIDPGVRINDPDLGTVLISVTDSSGNGVSGVSVQVTPSTPANGATSLDAQPDATDSEGCTYALKVQPGNYDVTVSKSGYVDVNQNASPSAVVSVEKSASSAAMLSLDLGSTFPIDYQTNYPGYTVQVPSNLDVSFLSTYGTSIAEDAPGSVVRYPFPAGYTVLAGMYNDPETPANFCKAVDPQEWLAGTTDGVDYDNGIRPAPVAALPGDTADTSNLGMGVVGFTVPNRSGGTYWYVLAVSQGTPPPGSGDPGCGISITYNLGQFREGTSTLDFTVPYGSWKFYSASNAGGSSSQLIPTASMHFHTTAHVSGDVVTFDPRPVIP